MSAMTITERITRAYWLTFLFAQAMDTPRTPGLGVMQEMREAEEEPYSQ